ncbi:MAG: amino acid adenylation domain-containing protein, partial [bacterium]|nr:amino acid adenylation domain-containing protein [bacterium]
QGEEDTAKIKKIALRQEVTPYMIYLALFEIMLAKLSGGEDIVTGTPTAGRRHVDLENIIGVFVNTLAIRNRPESGKRFDDYLREVKNKTLKAFENQDYQFEDIVEMVEVERDMSRNPLFDAMFVLQNMESRDLKIPGLQLSPYKTGKTVSKFDLILEGEEWQEKLNFKFKYRTAIFKKETIEKFVGYYNRITKSVLTNTTVKISDIRLISEEEKKKIIEEFNDTKAEYPEEITIHRLFEEQVERTPGNPAVIKKENEDAMQPHKLTYRQLNKKANQLAYQLRKRGMKAGTIAAIKIERSLELIIAIMGILKVGGAYLPISTDNPPERTAYIIRDSGAQLLLTQKKQTLQQEDIERIDVDREAICEGPVENPPGNSTAGEMIYIIYTSGSTGNPKGVVVEHRSVVNRLNWMQRRYPIGEHDVILQKTPVVFDVSVWELFWWSSRGAAVRMLAPGDEKSPAAIVEAIEQEKVTTIHFVPSMLSIFLEHLEGTTGEADRIAGLKWVFASGEALTQQQAERFNRILNRGGATRLINLYGPTEATVDVTYYDIPSAEELTGIPIGKPIDNIRLYVVDKNRKIQPIGVTGELCIAGTGLARGYLNNPELTAEKFYKEPPTPAQQHYEKRLYHTGDLASWQPDGNIRYLGRLDHQIKIRGFRIELGEI